MQEQLFLFVFADEFARVGKAPHQFRRGFAIMRTLKQIGL
jgi:hypothetical protein